MAINRDDHLRHRLLLCLPVDDGADLAHRGIETAGNLAVGRFQAARTGHLGIEFGSQPRPVGTERLVLVRENLPIAIGLKPPVECGVERIKRQSQPSRRRIDQSLIGHVDPRFDPFLTPSARAPKNAPNFSFYGKKSFASKQLAQEAYVLPLLSVNA
jgi:hypothetical protein